MKKAKLISIFFIICFSFLIFARQPISSKRFEILSGISKSKSAGDNVFWDKKYSKMDYVYGKSPVKFLASNYQYIPRGARVLDMGMGEGRNAVYLARKGYRVTGVDISSVAIRKSRLLAREFGVRINAIVDSMNQIKITPGSYDAIICFYFVDRSLNKKIVKWLRPGGILIYESYTDNQKKVKDFEKYNKNFLLRPGELIHMFPGLKILKYEEPIHMRDYTASIILQKSQ